MVGHLGVTFLPLSPGTPLPKANPCGPRAWLLKRQSISWASILNKSTHYLEKAATQRKKVNNWKTHQRIPKGLAIAYVVWLPYAHAYASLTRLHVWLTRRTSVDVVLREAYAGSFGTVRIGTAYASLLWLHFLSFWLFVASFPFILAFCAFTTMMLMFGLCC